MFVLVLVLVGGGAARGVKTGRRMVACRGLTLVSHEWWFNGLSGGGGRLALSIKNCRRTMVLEHKICLALIKIKTLNMMFGFSGIKALWLFAHAWLAQACKKQPTHLPQLR